MMVVKKVPRLGVYMMFFWAYGERCLLASLPRDQEGHDEAQPADGNKGEREVKKSRKRRKS